ncbi:MAG: DUF4339 domain-containing protein [Chlamydiae bacterium]|nr:DUF4339 domain-containing protein [Chlamydiota bacterium]
MSSSFLLVTGLALGTLAAYLAKRRGLNPYFWFGIGLFFGALGICVMFLFPKKTEGSNAVPTPPAPPVLSKKNTLWYYLDQNHTQSGPISEDFLQELFQKNTISEETYLWCEDMDNWGRYKEIFVPK